MAKKSGILIKVIVVIAVIGAVFFALDTWRKKSADPETAPADTAESATSTGAALSREEAERIGTEIGTRIGTEIGTQIGREVAAEMLAARAGASPTAPAPTEQPAAVEPAPAPVAEPAAPAVADTASSEPETTVTESTPAPAVARAPRAKTTQGRIPGTPIAEPVQGRDTWWTKSNTGNPDALVLGYAGHFKSTDGKVSGIALMFAGRFDTQTDFSLISPGKWELGATRGLIYLPRIPPGTYTVTIKAGFKDADGKTVKSDIAGPVTVK